VGTSLTLASAAPAGAVFFYRGQATGRDRLAQRIAQNTCQPAHHRQRLFLPQQPAGFFQLGGRQLGSFSPRLSRKESGRATLPIKLGGSLDRHQRHPKGFGDVPLRRAALHDQLTGEQTKTGQVTLGVREDRQMPIVIDDLIAFAPARQIAIELDAAVGENRKLDLGHAQLLIANGQRPPV